MTYEQNRPPKNAGLDIQDSYGTMDKPALPADSIDSQMAVSGHLSLSFI